MDPMEQADFLASTLAWIDQNKQPNGGMEPKDAITLRAKLQAQLQALRRASKRTAGTGAG